VFDVSKKVALGAALAAPLASMLPASQATAAPAPPTSLDHCVTHALSPQQLKDGQRSVLTCYATLDESLAAIGAPAGAGIEPVGLSDGVSTSATSVLLATHFDAPDGSGASLLVYGECNGGGISLEGSAWNDRISATRNSACATVKHFDSTSYSGLQENTVGGLLSTLGLLNNGVGSIKYTN
jgi:hypothetical protein